MASDPVPGMGRRHRPRLEHEHTREAIRIRLAAGGEPSYLRDVVYGGIDGTVTTFAIVAGVVGAGLPPFAILALGAANLLGDGFSMAAGNFSATRTERDEIERVRAIERKHIALDPEGEREEIRQIFEAKGFTGTDLERAVDVITGKGDRWIKTMVTEEYGLPAEARSPIRAALATFAAFFVCGLVPLLPFLLGLPHPFAISAGATGLTFFAIGSARARYAARPAWKAGLETLATGAAASVIAYAAGRMVERIASAGW